MSCFYGAMSVLEKSAHGGAYTREHEYVNKAIGYIKSNYGYPIQVSDLARYIGIDRTYLYRIFFASESMSPKQYLMQVRINAAKKMLLSGAYTCLLYTSYTRPKTKGNGHPWWAYVYDEYFDDVICPEYRALHYSTTNREG